MSLEVEKSSDEGGLALAYVECLRSVDGHCTVHQDDASALHGAKVGCVLEIDSGGDEVVDIFLILFLLQLFKGLAHLHLSYGDELFQDSFQSYARQDVGFHYGNPHIQANLCKVRPFSFSKAVACRRAACNIHLGR